jgi:hypothetical protein
MRGKGCGPRGQRALDAEGRRRRATADRRVRMLLATVAVCYGVQGTMHYARCRTPAIPYYYWRMC